MTAPLDHRPGDVIMFANGSDCLGRLIMELDASPYSHSGVVIGDDEISHISGKGSETSTISQRATADGIYHLITTHSPTATDEQIAAICAEAERLADADLSYGDIQLLLAGLLLMGRRTPGALRPVAHLILAAFSKLVDDLVDRGETMMICSDFVYQSFMAGGIDLLPDGVPELPHGDDPTLDEWLAEQPDVIAPSREWFEKNKDELLDQACALYEWIRGRSPSTDDAPTDTPTDAEVDVAALVAARDAAHAALDRALGPRPDAEVIPEFVSPGDLLRGGTLVDHGRWER